MWSASNFLPDLSVSPHFWQDQRSLNRACRRRRVENERETRFFNVGRLSSLLTAWSLHRLEPCTGTPQTRHGITTVLTVLPLSRGLCTPPRPGQALAMGGQPTTHERHIGARQHRSHTCSLMRVKPASSTAHQNSCLLSKIEKGGGVFTATTTRGHCPPLPRGSLPRGTSKGHCPPLL